MNLFEGRVVTTDGDRRFDGPFTVELSPDAPPGVADGEVVLGVRPEDVSLCPDGTPGQVSGIVELGERIGSDVYLNVRIAEESTIVISADASNKIREGRDRLHADSAEQALFLRSRWRQIEADTGGESS